MLITKYGNTNVYKEEEMLATKEKEKGKKKEKKGIAKVAEENDAVVRTVGIKTWVSDVEGFEGDQAIKNIAKITIKEAGRVYPAAYNWYLRKLAEAESVSFVKRWERAPRFTLKDEDAKPNKKGKKPNRKWYNNEGEEFNSPYSLLRNVFPELSVGQASSISADAQSAYTKNRIKFLQSGFLPFYKSSLYVVSHHSVKVIKENNYYKISTVLTSDIFKEVIVCLKKEKEASIRSTKIKKDEKEKRRKKYKVWLKDISKFKEYLKENKKVKVILAVDASHKKNWSRMALEQNYKKTGQLKIQINNNGDWFAHLGYYRPKIKSKKLSNRILYVYVAEGGALKTDVCENGKMRGWVKTITFDAAIHWKKQFGKRWMLNKVKEVDRRKEEEAIIQIERNDALRKAKRNDFRCTGVKTCRKGHGLKRKFKATDKLKILDKAKKDYFNHTKADYIIRIASDSKCCQVKMVDLCGYKADTLVLGEWPYYDLMLKIEQKCNEKDIKWEKIQVEKFEENLKKIINNK